MGDPPTNLQYPCASSHQLPTIPLMFTRIAKVCSEKCALSRDYRVTETLAAANTAGSLVITPSPGGPDERSQVVTYNGCKYDFVMAEVFCPGITQFKSGSITKTAPAEIALTHQQGGGANCDSAGPSALTICVPLGSAPAAGGRYTTRDLNAVLSQILQLNPQPQPPQAKLPTSCTGDYMSAASTANNNPCPYQAATCASATSGSTTKTCGGGRAPNAFVGGGNVVMVTIADFSFNQAVPTAPYCTYVQPEWPYPVSLLNCNEESGCTAGDTASVGCATSAAAKESGDPNPSPNDFTRQVVVVQPTHIDGSGMIASQVTLTPDTLSALGKLIVTPPPSLPGASPSTAVLTVAKKGDDLMAISKGPQTADDIYIDCQPTGSDGEEIVEFSSPALGVAQWGESLVNFVTNNALFGAMFGGIVMWFLMKFVKKFFRRLGATKALVADADSEDGQADLASKKQIKARGKGAMGKRRMAKRGAAGKSAGDWARRKKGAMQDAFKVAKGADRKTVRTERLKENMRQDAAAVAKRAT